MTENKAFFMVTQKYRRFAEICTSCHQSNYMGLCFGKPGVGKTESARHLAKWQTIEPLLGKPVRGRSVPSELLNCNIGFYTPDVVTTPKRLHSGIAILRNKFDELIEQATSTHDPRSWAERPKQRHLQLLIVDEAQRLTYQALEQLRDFHDRGGLSIVLMGPPGFERRLQRNNQFRDRIGIVYEFEVLNADETKLFIAQKWLQLGLPLSADDAVSSAIVKITGGNLRRLHRVFMEIERLQNLNCFPLITLDVIEAARQSLLPSTT